MEDKLNFDKGIWRKVLKFLSPYKKMFYKLGIVAGLFGLFEATYPMLSKYAIDNFVVKKTMEGFGIFVLLYIIVFLSNIFVMRQYMVMTGRVEGILRYEMRKKGFEKLMELSLSYFDRTSVGSIMSRMSSDIYSLTETICWGFLDFGFGLINLTFYMIFMLMLDVKLALLGFIVLPIIGLMTVYIQKLMIHLQRQVKETNSKITASYNEDIQGAKTTKTLVREDKNYEEFTELTGDYKGRMKRLTRLSSIFMPSIISLGSISTALVLTVGGADVLVGAISIGTLSAMLSYTLQCYEPVRMMGMIFAELISAQASAERVFKLLFEEPEIFEREEVLEKYGRTLEEQRKKIPAIKGDVEFNNVSFYYNEKEPVIDNFNLKVKAGETIALVGETGAGKSTLINLFSRFYEPVKGEILIDGEDYKNYPQSYIHANLGYVLQSPYLFSGTIKDNVKYGKQDASDEEVEKACRMVKAHDFIMKMEKAYDSEVGEGGGLLSTGEKQLISFARAIIREPRLFVLDEATSSVDTETEKVIQDAIKTSLEGRTSFIVAHRLSTIRNADRILLIKKGKIAEMGSHDELMKEKGAYYKLYMNQFIAEN
ncbi:MAG: ABC transporter ATP-binding protein [Tissierellia bacterium]|nr:ABC transporter ATP-binding protein [Tissierellia bacterium]